LKILPVFATNIFTYHSALVCQNQITDRCIKK
jgi:hypothetical protein